MAKFGAHEVADVTLYDYATGKPILFLDSLKLSNLENNAETVAATGGKGNTKLVQWDFGRTAVFNVQDALLDPAALSEITGNAYVVGATTIHANETLTAETGETGKTKVTLSETPLTTTGTYSAFKYVDGALDTNGTNEITGITVDDTAKTMTFDATAVPVGTVVKVFYQYTSGADTKKFKISSDKFPGYFKVVGDTVMRNTKTGNDEPFQIVIHKAKLASTFTLTLQASGDPSVFDFKLEAERPAGQTDMVDFIQY